MAQIAFFPVLAFFPFFWRVPTKLLAANIYYVYDMGPPDGLGLWLENINTFERLSYGRWSHFCPPCAQRRVKMGRKEILRNEAKSIYSEGTKRQEIPP